MTIALSQRKPKQGVVARFCSPLGQYPTGCFGSADEGYLSSDDAVMTAVRYRELPRSEDYYSEVEWAEPHEIRFFASLALARESGEGAIIIYPLPLAFYPDLSQADALGKASLLRDLKDALATEMKRTRRRQAWYYRSLVAPPFMSRRRYTHCGRGFAHKRYELILSAIRPDDFLMVRALSTWIRSSILACHYQFMEEAITTLFISMEASFRLVLRRLRELGNPNPTSTDAAEFVGHAFHEAPLDHYLQEYYESRIKTFHPESRFGVYPHAPLMVDDYYHLHESLRELYVFLLIGYVDPEYLARPRLHVAA